jgi:HAD superfamily hydrolase (TIGR01509 family)
VTALVFDCDGVLADTERYGHLPAFNATFEAFDLPVRWSVEDYARMLRIGGGKERLAVLLDDPAVAEAAGSPGNDDEKAAVVARWHRHKTEAFTTLVAEGRIPPRAGVARVIADALAAGWTVAVASTSAEVSVRAVLSRAVGADTASRIPVFAGDVVPRKKPDPAIYDLAVTRLELDRSGTLVVEDSRNGLRAAVGAGLPALITVNDYTRNEDFSEAELVVSSLGDPGDDPLDVLADPHSVDPRPYVTLDHIRSALGARSGAGRS